MNRYTFTMAIPGLIDSAVGLRGHSTLSAHIASNGSQISRTSRYSP
jgi:hypothetical protein